MSFGRRLKKARTEKHMTQRQLAEKLSVKHNSISNWENDVNKPDPDTIEIICGVLDITPNYLLANSSDDFSPFEKLLIKRYRSLDEAGMKHIDYELDRECERVREIEELKSKLNTEFSSEIVPYPYLGKIACAGTGFYFDDIPTEIIKAPYMDGADFIIGVSGESMEPSYHDGEKLYVKKVEFLHNGDTGIFTINNECFLKELGNDGLVSVNKKYDNISGSEDVRLIGKVIEKVKE